MHFVDHLVVLALATLLPWYTWRSQRVLAARIRLGERPNRPRLDLQTSAAQWGALLALALLWFLQERSLASLGFVTPGGTGFWSGAAIDVSSQTSVSLSGAIPAVPETNLN